MIWCRTTKMVEKLGCLASLKRAHQPEQADAVRAAAEFASQNAALPHMNILMS